MLVVADSSAIISAFVKADRNHKKAVEIKKTLEKNRGIIYIPIEIFAETINIIGKKLNHATAVKLGEALLHINLFFILPSNDNIRLRALQNFQNQPASVSFTDCVVMAFADEYETKDIFGFDETFRRNGYVRIGIDKREDETKPQRSKK